MKKEMVEYMSRFILCQWVKVEHQCPARLLNVLPIFELKWEVIYLDFIMELPRTKEKHDSIMVVVEKLSKETHFMPVYSTFGMT